MHIEALSIDHVVLFSPHDFQTVRTRLEAMVPTLDTSFLDALRRGDAEDARRRLESGPPLSIFGTRDHGALLAIAGLRRRAVQYDIGNPLTASKMTRYAVSAALYAPIRVLLRDA